MDIVNENRCNRYRIDTERLVRDFGDEYDLCAYCKGNPASIKHYLSLKYFSGDLYRKFLINGKKKGLNITDYWLQESGDNKICVKREALLEFMQRNNVTDRKLKNKGINHWYDSHSVKYLDEYMRFCELFNIGYSEYCDQNDYIDYFKNKDNNRTIKDVSQQCISELFLPKETMIEWAKYEEKDFGRINMILSHRDNMSAESKLLLKKYRSQLKHDLLRVILLKLLEEKFNIHICKPAYTEKLLDTRNIYYLWKDCINGETK